MAVLKQTSPTATPAAPAPLPSIIVPSASTSRPVGRCSVHPTSARARGGWASAARVSRVSVIVSYRRRLAGGARVAKSGARTATTRPQGPQNPRQGPRTLRPRDSQGQSTGQNILLLEQQLRSTKSLAPVCSLD